MPGKILVTGGAGFIGSHTVVALSEGGYEPVIVDNFSNSERSVPSRIAEILGREIPCHEIDCTSASDLAAVLEESAPVLGVVHFAAFKSVGESMQEPLKYYSNNLGSTSTLIEVMLQAAVAHLVFSSSCTVYGQAESPVVTEESSIQTPASVYGRTKQICEAMIKDTVAAQRDLKAVCLRYFNPIGAHPSALIGELPIGTPDNLVPYITQTAAGLRDHLTVFGDDYDTADGSCVRDYIHVVDLAQAHVKAVDWLLAQEAPRLLDFFNLGTGRGTSVLEAVSAFEAASGESLKTVIGPRREGDVVAIYADPTKAEKVLGWTAKLGVEQAMRDSWRWQQCLAESAD